MGPEDKNGDIHTPVMPDVREMEVVIRGKDQKGRPVEAVFPVCRREDSDDVELVEVFDKTQVLSEMSYKPVRSDETLMETRLELSLVLGTKTEEDGRSIMYRITRTGVTMPVSSDTVLPGGEVPPEEVPSMDLPGMWDHSDFMGGATDTEPC